MKTYKIFILSFLISCATLFCYAQDSEKTLLIFGAKWCSHCTAAKNDLKTNTELVEATKNYTLIELDYDKDKEIIKGHDVKTLPTFIIFQGGKEKKRSVGYKGPRHLTKFLTTD